MAEWFVVLYFLNCTIEDRGTYMEEVCPHDFARIYIDQQNLERFKEDIDWDKYRHVAIVPMGKGEWLSNPDGTEDQ